MYLSTSTFAVNTASILANSSAISSGNSGSKVCRIRQTLTDGHHRTRTHRWRRDIRRSSRSSRVGTCPRSSCCSFLKLAAVEAQFIPRHCGQSRSLCRLYVLYDPYLDFWRCTSKCMYHLLESWEKLWVIFVSDVQLTDKWDFWTELREIIVRRKSRRVFYLLWLKRDLEILESYLNVTGQSSNM